MALLRNEKCLVRLPQADASGRQRSMSLRQAHFITTSKKGGVNLVGREKLLAILNENTTEVKVIL
jgi:hypothetical protein